MLDILRSYLDDSASPELVSSLVAAHAVLDRVQLPNYEQGFQELVMLADDVEVAGTVQSVVDLTNALLHQVLTEHEILLTEEAPIDILTLFINGVMDIQNFSNHTELLQVATIDAHAEERLAEILALVTKLTADELLPYIDTVSDGLIEKIKELASDVEDEGISDADLAVREQVLINFRKFEKLTNNTDLYITHMLKQGLDIGYPFSVYANLMAERFEQMPADQAARELVAITIVSDDGAKNPRGVIQHEIDHYITDIDLVTKVNIEIGKLLLGMQQ